MLKEPFVHLLMHSQAGSELSGPSEPKKRKHKQRFNRSKTGCLSCRRRRIRCDEAHPICERCSDAKITCDWPSAGTSSRNSRATSKSLSTEVTGIDGSGWRLPMLQGSEWTAGDLNGHGMGGIGEVVAGSTVGTSCSMTGGAAISSVPHPLHAIQSSSQTPHQPPNTTPISANNTQWSDVKLDTWARSYPSPAGASHTVDMLDLFTPGSTHPSQDVLRPTSPPLASMVMTPTTYPPFNAPPVTHNLSLTTLASRRRGAPTAVTWSNVHIPLNLPITIDEPIEHVFPSSGSKRLFQHVKSSTSTMIVALGTGHQNTKNPFMGMATRLMLLAPKSHAQTAFRHSLLSLASAHVAHRYQGTSPVQCQEMRVRTAKSKRKAMLFLTMDDRSEGYTDLLLATCLTLFLRNKLYADNTWKQGLDTAITHVLRRAGPGSLLVATLQHTDRRFLLEQIAVADLFSTFTTGEEPRLLGEGAVWWGQSAATATETEWESYERFLGLSRIMTETLAKYRILFARHLQLEKETWLQGKAADTARQAHITEAEAMLEALQRWSAEQVDTPARKRVMAGDSAYRYMIVISLSIEVLLLDVTDPIVQAAVRSVLELCSEMSQEPLHLVWPLLTAGACAVNESDRSWARQLFALLGEESCRDIDVARDILHEQWARLDCGKRFTPWPTIMKDLGVQVCLM